MLIAELTAEKTPVREVILGWKQMLGKDSRVLGDRWERGYGDLGWKKPEKSGVMPWYFMEDQKEACLGYGVMVRSGAMCWWEIKGQDVLLHLDVLSGSGTPFFVSVKPGLLNAAQEKELKAAYQKAAVNTQIAVPLDWKETEKPQKWRTFEGIKHFIW